MILTLLAVAAALPVHDPLSVQNDFFIVPNPLSARNYAYQLQQTTNTSEQISPTIPLGCARWPLAQNGGAWEYLLPDALGSVRQSVDANGNVTLAKSYEPYGSVLTSTPLSGTQAAGTASSIFGFSGEQIVLNEMNLLATPLINKLGQTAWEPTGHVTDSFEKLCRARRVLTDPIYVIDPGLREVYNRRPLSFYGLGGALLVFGLECNCVGP